MTNPTISLSDMEAVEAKANSLKTEYPGTPEEKLLNQAAHDLYGARDYEELNGWRKATIRSYLRPISGRDVCSYCGCGIISSEGADVMHHQSIHNRFEKAIETLGYRPLISREQDESRSQGWSEMNKDQPIELRIKGALKLLRTFFDQSLETAIRNDYWKEHPSFEKYAAYFTPNPGFFPEEIEGELLRMFGRIPGEMTPGQQHWNPPRATRLPGR